MCDRGNSDRIVAELLAYLADAEFDIKEELVLKIAILAEKFAANYAWYVNTILTLIASAPDDVPDDIWFRIVQIVTNHDDIQEYACTTALKVRLLYAAQLQYADDLCRHSSTRAVIKQLSKLQAICWVNSVILLTINQALGTPHPLLR